ncbi:glycerophosphodiester phosphodiesterase [Marinicrinis sediminis]|uniref:Glycerophosphodiester phosphodiesterase n=1 Tax=Marinicrinis sediminis TaxID=1652465 RepID=A0ABW5RD22_9BACL
MTIRGVAHRGYPKKYPENTMSGFQAALDLQYDHLELDVHLSKDGVPVVIHDPTVDRVTNGTGYVQDFTLAELKQLVVKDVERIPTLEEVLSLVKGQIIVDIELKQAGAYAPKLEEQTLEVVQKLDMLDEVFFTSFDHYAMLKLRSLSADAQLGIINYGCTPSAFDFLKQINGQYLSMNHVYFSEYYLHECVDRGIQLILWTVDQAARMETLSAYPDLLVCTNELERWKPFGTDR